MQQKPILGDDRAASEPAAAESSVPADPAGTATAPEIGGRGGLDPVRYGDWEKNGRCIDF